jgi:ribosomal protein S18 acetylase RimI-like enzyme
MVDVLAPPNSLVIRPMRREEVAPLAEAIVEMSEAQIANRWRERELGYRELLVAELDGRLVGTVSLYESDRPDNSIHLFALEVGPLWRRQGIGSALVQHVIEEARRRGRARVYLEVRTDNPARRIYHRLGFRRVGHAFINAWYRFGADGSQERMEELSYLMVKRVGAGNRQQATGNK